MMCKPCKEAGNLTSEEPTGNAEMDDMRKEVILQLHTECEWPGEEGNKAQLSGCTCQHNFQGFTGGANVVYGRS